VHCGGEEGGSRPGGRLAAAPVRPATCGGGGGSPTRPQDRGRGGGRRGLPCQRGKSEKARSEEDSGRGRETSFPPVRNWVTAQGAGPHTHL